MIQTTVQNVVDETVEGDMKDHYLYMVSDKDVIFYIGRSFDPINRIHQHLALPDAYWPSPACDSLGILINDNLPNSPQWTVTFFTLADVQPNNIPPRVQPRNIDSFIDETETELIQKYKPCLNSMKRNYSNPLPDKYNKRRIVNAGIKQSQ